MQDLEKIAEEMLNSMTLEEKFAQLQCLQIGREPLDEGMAKYPNGVGQTTVFGGKQTAEENMMFAKEIKAEAEKYSKIPPLMHGEAVTGLNAAQGTIFPSAIGLGATWDSEVVFKMADTIRKQMLSIGVRQALSPVMDVARDPRWGRVGETYGEDPTLCAKMSVAFTKGLQTDNLENGVVATGKHFLGYGRSEGGLNMAANPIPQRELREVYAKPFQAAITEAGLESIMNSYGSIDGELVIQSENILNDLLRTEMGFDGIVVSDYMSVDKAVDLHVSETPLEGGKRALLAGLDMELPKPYGYMDELLEEIRKGDVKEELLDRAVRRILKTKIKLGFFKRPVFRNELLTEAYNRAATEKVSLQAARESIVLLKNDGTLPLEKKEQKIAVIGPHGDSLRLLFGCYTYPATLDMMLSGSMRDVAGLENNRENSKSLGEPKYQCYPGSDIRVESEKVTEVLEKLYGDITPTIVQAIQTAAPRVKVLYEQGCEIAGNDRGRFKQAAELAKNSDIVILTVGGKYGWGANCTTGEGIDTDRIGLPGVQEELAKELYTIGKPLVVVHMDAKPLSSRFISENANAVLEIWFPGDTGGQALAEVLFGDYNPAGRLPVTAARTEGQIPVYAGHRRGSGYSKTLGMTLCKYVEGEKQPLYYFGEGMSYTEFSYQNLQLDKKEVGADDSIRVSCIVENTGERDGDEVVQLYITDEIASLIRPHMELAGFARVHIRKGEKKKIVFNMKVSQFAFLDKKMEWIVEEGTMKVLVASSSNAVRLEKSFSVINTKKIDGKTRGFYADVKIQPVVG